MSVAILWRTEAVAAQTRYAVIANLMAHDVKFEIRNSKFEIAVIRCFPLTGRLHQIRVHLAALGHPILGDPLYRGEGEVYKKMVAGTVTPEDRASLGFPRLALHAEAIEFQHPITGEALRAEAPLPEEMEGFLRAAQNGAPSRLRREGIVSGRRPAVGDERQEERIHQI